eukprot:6140230-Pyramimonas_sp.AAC.1
MRTLPLGPSVELLSGHGPREECPKWPEAAMRTLPVAPSVELRMGPRSTVLGGRNAGKEERGGAAGGGGETRGAVSSKRGPNTTGWLGTKMQH